LNPQRPWTCRIKKRATKKSVANEALVPIPQLIDLGASVPVSVKSASANEIVLTLSDGTKMRVKPVVMGIARSTEKFNATDEPIYQFNVGMMIVTDVPKRLKKRPRQ
jgi:hypothetical protein